MITERQSDTPFEQPIPRKLFLIGFLAILATLNIDELQAQSIPETERAALISLYESTDGDNWKDNTNWNGPVGTECSWYGVNCSAGAVYYLNLSENNLNGKIPAAIGNLTRLKYLYLYANSLSGVIPSELGNLTELQFLYLFGNSLSGVIPPELWNLIQLEQLQLQRNLLSGSIPATIGNLTKLEYLSFHTNSLSGSIPETLGDLAMLNRLYLAENSLTGKIPAQIGNLIKLEFLDLSGNSLSGVIPHELGNLIQLTSIQLASDKQYIGELPDSIKNLPNISYKNDFHSLRFIDFDVDYDGIPDSYDLDTSRADQYKKIKEKDYTILFSENGVIVNLVYPTLHKFMKGGSSNEIDREISNIIYEHFSDDFDWLMVAPVCTLCARTNYNKQIAPIASGLGLENEDSDFSALYGTSGGLNNYMFLVSPAGLGKNGAGTHEIMHTWAASHMFESTNVGHNGFSNIGGMLGGWKPNTLRNLGGNTYQIETLNDDSEKAVASNGWGTPRIPYSKFELYLAGLIAPEEVDYDIKLAKGFTWLDLYKGTFGASSIETTTVNDFIKKFGPRIPNHLNSQKIFEAMQVIVSEKPLTKEDINEYSGHVFWLQSTKDDGDDSAFNFWESTLGKAQVSFNQSDHVISKAINFRHGNLAPVIDLQNVARVFKDQDGVAGEKGILAPTLSDDGEISTVQWSINGEVVASGQTPTISLADGVSILTILVTDNDFETTSAVITIDVKAPFNVDSTWKKPFNGVPPKDSLNLSFNNIGSYDFSNKIISSCLRLTTNGEPISYNGISQLEVNFAVVSDELGIIRLINSRNFNSLNLLDSNDEKPDCSGQFDTSTNVYADTIETTFSYSGLQDMVISIVKTFDMKFTLYDGENLLFRLDSFRELTP